MTVLAKGLTATGVLFLSHAIYSAHEHLHARNTTASLPPDVVLETLLATLLLTLAIVASAPSLRPIQWREWAGKIEREAWDPNAPPGAAKGAGNPYAALEARRGFWDVLGQRKEFATWIKEGS